MIRETINGVSRCLGLVYSVIQIGYLKLKVKFFVIKNSKKDLLIGLDLIKQFQLEISPYQHND